MQNYKTAFSGSENYKRSELQIAESVPWRCRAAARMPHTASL